MSRPRMAGIAAVVAVLALLVGPFGSTPSIAQANSDPTDRETVCQPTAATTLLSSNGLSAAGTHFFSQNTVYDAETNAYLTFYLDDGGYTSVIPYDLESGEYGSPQRIAQVGTNYHFYAAAVIDDAGYFHLFHGMHVTDVQYSRSVRPYDITSWETVTLSESDRGTYPFLFAGEGGELTAFYRSGGTSLTGDQIEMARSNDRGTTWTYQTIVDMNDTKGANGNYLYVNRFGADQYHIAFTQRFGSADAPGSFSNIRYIKSTDGGLNWKTAAGTALALPATSASIERISSETGRFVSSIDFEADGTPHVVYSEQALSVANFFDNAALKIASWDSATASWVHQTISADSIHKYHARLRIGEDGRFAVYVPAERNDGTHDLIVYESTSPSGPWTSRVLVDEGMDVRAPHLPREKDVPLELVNFHSGKDLFSVRAEGSPESPRGTAGPSNVALGGSVTASTTNSAEYPPAALIDGSAASECRWTSADSSSGSWAQIELAEPSILESATVHSSWTYARRDQVVADWTLEYWNGSEWEAIPGGGMVGNRHPHVELEFEQPVRTTRVRISTPETGHMRLREVMLWGRTISSDNETAAPAVGVLSSDNGWDTGLTDGNYRVTMNLWWGSNATRMRLFENGTEIADKLLAAATPQPQSTSIAVADRPNGVYEYEAELINSRGSTWIGPLKVVVRDAAPGMPVLRQDGQTEDGSFTLTADLWWGTNATSYQFKQGEDVVAEGSLTSNTPNAQRASVDLRDLPPGVYYFTAVFANTVGATSSRALEIAVE